MQLIDNIDWDLLRQQKAWLLTHAIQHQSEMAAGLVNLLDELQDQAVQSGTDELLVFGGHDH